jgi:hypothetical protein
LESVTPPDMLFFFKIVLALLAPLPFHVSFRISMLFSIEKAAGIFKIVIALTL